MATTNKALTTYLPTESVEWLERYCLDYKHLLNKEGNPKLGTALADIVSRLTDGELTLPLKIEPISTVIDNAQYSTEISTLKGEVEDLKKLLTEYGNSKLPDTVLDLEAVNKCIDTAIDNRVSPLIELATARVVADEKALEKLVKVNIEPLADLLAELETYTQSQALAVREELKELKKPLAIAR